MKKGIVKSANPSTVVSVILYAVFAMYILLLGLYNAIPGFSEKLKLLEESSAFFSGIRYNWFEVTMAMTLRYWLVFALGLAGCIMLTVEHQMCKKRKITVIIMPVFFFVLSCLIQQLNYSGHGLYKLADVLVWVGIILIILSFAFFLKTAIKREQINA